MAVSGAWGKARGAVIQIAAEAMQYDVNGVDIYFLNSLLLREGIVVSNDTKNSPQDIDGAVGTGRSRSDIRTSQTPRYLFAFFPFVGFYLKHSFVGPSPIGARLESVLKKITLQLEQAKRNISDYGQIRPFNIVVLTNSSPSDEQLSFRRRCQGASDCSAETETGITPS